MDIIKIKKNGFNEKYLLNLLNLKKEDIEQFSFIYVGSINEYSEDYIEPQKDIYKEAMIVIETCTGGYKSEKYCLFNAKLYKHPNFVCEFDYPGDLRYKRFFFRVDK